GVLRVLEQNRIPINCIAGTSVGALVAAAYASGLSLDEMQKKAGETHFKDFGRWTFSWMGLATNHRLEGYLRRYSEMTQFEQMKLPLAIVATDLGTGQAVSFTHGPLGPALRASCAYPGLFLPVEHQGRTLVDGFLAAPVPADAVRQLGADVVIAVYLEPGSIEKPRNMVDVIGRSFSIIQRYADLGWRRKADVIIEPNVKHFVWDDFEKAPEMIAAGEAATRAALPKILRALAPPAAKSVS
ncbi:MAG TPA: patatin-like phospholipase family protein, partial [Candidatus Acidoferrales bacterium]|nr:patatin-like phospholipase family protein [Candidatus Acidoferrales bacterium]